MSVESSGSLFYILARGQKPRYFPIAHYAKSSVFVHKSALDFDSRVIFSFRSGFSTLRFSLKIKSFAKQNMFYRSDILHDFSISSF